jgi:carbonic anhydrase
MSKFSDFEFRTQPWFDQNNFQGFNQAIPMKTIVIYCFDPRAAEIPHAVAKHFGNEVYPGENILDEAGNRIGNTQTLFTVSNAGGRALSALQTVATMEYLFHVQNVIVVHHSFCGATAFRPDQLVDLFHDHHHADIEPMFEHESLAITDYEKSIKHDVALLRNSPAVPKNINLYGFFYEMNSGELTEIVRDIPKQETPAV